MPNRRQLLQVTAGMSALTLSSSLFANAAESNWKITNKRIRQSVVPWCFKTLKLPELAKAAQTLGIESVELCSPKEWPLLKELGLTCAIAGSHGFAKGFAHVEEHAECPCQAARKYRCGSCIWLSQCDHIFGFFVAS